MSRSPPPLTAKSILDILNMPAPPVKVRLPILGQLERFYAKGDESRSKSRSPESHHEDQQFSKDMVCAFDKKGQCSKGKDCRFIHENSHLPTKYKTEICKGFMQGYCHFRDRCSFAHGKHELRVEEKHV